MTPRRETDLLGTISVPDEALYGAQTQRAVENFPVRRERTIGSFPTLVKALLRVKKAAAMVNQEIGALPGEKARAIIQAADTLLERPSPEQFPIHYLHGGGGTSANMNANEVLANLAEELLGGRRGEYRVIHPNDAVNLHQSTNDVYPTACHMAVLAAFLPLQAVLAGLAETIKTKEETYRDSVRLARTCYQDAVDITFGNFFSGYSGFVTRRLRHLEQAVDELHAVNLGGTIVGRASDVPAAYLEKVIPTLRQVTGDAAYHHPDSLFDAAQNADELASVSAQLDLFARGLVKIAQDVRVLSSGPQAGLGELLIPPVQPGSSIMPGKINPVIPEFLMQICFKVMGNHAGCSAGLDHGELDLNVWESSMVFSILESMEILENGVAVFTQSCLAGLQPVAAVNDAAADTIIPRLTRLAYRYGYQRVSAVCQQAGGDLALLAALLGQEFGNEAE